MKKIDEFIGLYPAQKTLQFSLLPIGKTEENIRIKKLVEEDDDRAVKYKKVKKIIDRYHKRFIDRVLSDVRIEGIHEYYQLFRKQKRTDSDNTKMLEMEKEMRSGISNLFIKDNEYKLLFSKNIITDILPSFLLNQEEINMVKEFSEFTTAFRGFFKNTRNMYVEEEKSTAIAYRCINQNLPRFINNIIAFEIIKASLSESTIIEINDNMSPICEPYQLTDCFRIDFFDYVLSQKGIDIYNSYIGGYVDKDGKKIQGLNEYINLYNQQLDKEENRRLPQLNVLYKQILSDKESVSFLPETFEKDQEVFDAIKCYYLGDANNGVVNSIIKIKELFEGIGDYDDAGLFWKAGLPLTNISNAVFGNWKIIQNGWETNYDEMNSGKTSKKNDENKRKEFKACQSFSLRELQYYGNIIKQDDCLITFYLKETVGNQVDSILESFESIKGIILNGYSDEKCLQKNEAVIADIKNFLDKIKELELFVKPLLGSGKENNRDYVFYGDFMPLFDDIARIDKLYNKIRNYVTKKPYKNDKFKLWFQNPQFLDGWDKNKENDYSAVILEKQGNYYLAVMDSKFRNSWKQNNDKQGKGFRKIVYRQIANPSRDFPHSLFIKSDPYKYGATDEIWYIYSEKKYVKGEDGFCIENVHKLIDYYKSGILQYKDWNSFGFNLKPTSEYNNIGSFFGDISKNSYRISFEDVSEDYIDKCIDEGDIFLFQIYCKDFSKCSKGTPNLHTMYFKMLFDEENLKNPVFQLNGGAEMFFRKSSIKNKDRIVHKAGQKIENKNPDNPKKYSVYKYDIVKDKRFTENQYSLHLPIKINWDAAGNTKINELVRKQLKSNDHNYVIGIDRGERNLLYVCVINEKGEIVEQMSLNQIINRSGDYEQKVDYHKLLDTKEKERLVARQNWSQIENIKELKEGYISQVVHQICELVVKYDAVIAMEDLNSGFKNSRIKIEKQVYQKFEKMLIEKLNYLVDKKELPYKNGGLLRGYQLTNAFTSFRNMGTQNGVIFYIPAWLTSKIDPATGFAALINPKYESIDKAKAFIKSFDSISFDVKEGLFAFELDMRNFERTTADFNKKWTLYSFGERIKTFRNPDKNSEWDNIRVDLTDEFTKLFVSNEIDLKKGNLIPQIVQSDSKDFFEKLLGLIKLMLQMRNSITGDVDTDYLISPVKNSKGEFYCSDNYKGSSCSKLPANADANGAYNIARKVLWAIEVLKNTDDDKLMKAKLAIKNEEWLKYAQEHVCEN